MSYADKLFKETCRDILVNGTDTKGSEARLHAGPFWEDTGECAYTIKKFGVINRYNLREEFPAITLRRIALKSAMDEILWIFQKKSNNILDLHSHIWDQWADGAGSIGKAYGYQFQKKQRYDDITPDGLQKAFPKGHLENYPEIDTMLFVGINVKRSNKRTVYALCDNGTWYMDQVNRVIYDLRNTPFSRRILTSTYNFEDLHDMALYPCAYSMTFNVTNTEEGLVLNAILNQRSQGMLAANGWNVAQYALLLMMLAQICHMIPGELVHVIADAHIYDRHIPMVEELLNRKEHPVPEVWLNPDIDDFYDFTVNDLHVENYVTGEQIRNIPIAV